MRRHQPVNKEFDQTHVNFRCTKNLDSSGIANGHQCNAKESFVIIMKKFSIDWRLYSDMLAIYGSNTVGQIPNQIEIFGNILPISVVLGGAHIVP